MEEENKKELREAVVNLTSARSKIYDVYPIVGTFADIARENNLQPTAERMGKAFQKIGEMQKELKETFEIVSRIYYMEKGKTEEEAEELTTKLNFEGVINRGMKDIEETLENIDKELDK